MIVHLVNIFIPYVFKRYLKKYNIYRDLHEIDLLGVEIRNLDSELAESARHIILRNKEICYVKKSDEYPKRVDLLILGSFAIFKDIAKDIVAVGNEDLGYKLTHLLQNYSSDNNHSLNLKSNVRKFSQTIVMGILNVTPDSFSDGGKYFADPSAAVEHGIKLIEQGADIIDIGGESTRPGSEEVPVSKEIERILPVIEGIKKKNNDACISIDTRKSAVAKAAIKAGAGIVNDVSGGEFDESMFEVCAESKTPLILMHSKGTPDKMQENPYYDDVVEEIYDYLDNRIKLAEKAGVKNIIIDPGIGFGKRISDNYELLDRLNEFKGLGKQILIGLSRKTFLGKSLGLDVNERDDATLAAETLAIRNGADIIRTHEVRNTVQAAKIYRYFQNPDS